MNLKLVIIPTYNESDNVERVSSAVLNAVSNADLLFVDDNSPDGTGQLIDTLIENDDRIKVLHRQDKDGLGRAYIAGFEWALKQNYQYIVQMDADLSHDPAALPDLFAAAENHDVVIGSRYVDGIRIMDWPLSRLILSKCASKYVRIITGIPFQDPTSGFNCYRRAVLEHLELGTITANGYSFLVELKHRAWILGFKLVEVPITFHERRSGESKMNAAIIREAILLMWKLMFKWKFRRRPLTQSHEASVASSN